MTEGQQPYELTINEQYKQAEDEYNQQYESTIEAQHQRAIQVEKDRQAFEDAIKRQLWTETEIKRAKIQREQYYIEKKRNFILNNDYPNLEVAERDFDQFRNKHEFLWTALANTQRKLQQGPDNSTIRQAEITIKDELQNLTNFIDEKTRKRVAAQGSPTPSVALTKRKAEKRDQEAPNPKRQIQPVHFEIESSEEENIVIDLTDEQKNTLAVTPVFITPKTKAEKKTVRISVQQTATRLHKQKLIQRNKKDQEKLKQQQENIKILQEREAFLTEQLAKVQHETLKRRESYDQAGEEDIERLQKSLHHAERQTYQLKTNCKNYNDKSTRKEVKQTNISRQEKNRIKQVKRSYKTHSRKPVKLQNIPKNC